MVIHGYRWKNQRAACHDRPDPGRAGRRSELSKGFISQVERNLTSPSIATLTDILQCLGTNLQEFFSEAPAEEQVVFKASDYFEKVDAELKNKIEWIIPNAQKNSMEPIRLTLAPGGSTYPGSFPMKEKNSVIFCPEASSFIWATGRSKPKRGNPFTSPPIRIIILLPVKKPALP